MITYEELNRMKYELENPILRDWALKYGLTDTASAVESHRDVYLGGQRIQWKNLSVNDKHILKQAVSWLRSNS